MSVGRSLSGLVVFGCVVACSSSPRGEASPADAAVPPAEAPLARLTSKFERDARGFRADSPAQRFSTLVAREGALLTESARRWSLQLAVQRVGRSGTMWQTGTDTPRELDGRVEIARGNGIREWFVHDERGLEQGIDLAERPGGAGDLLVEIGAEGLTPVKMGSRVELHTHDGASALTYGGLEVRDATGAHVDASMDVERGRIVLRVRDGAATYPINIDPLVWGLRQTQLLGSYDGQLGRSVSVQGPLVLVGAHGESDSATAQGAVYVFQRSGSAWTRQARLVAGDYAAYDLFGSSVALNGSLAVIGARQKTIGGNSSQGAVYVFSQSGSTWSQDTRIVAADGAANDGFGASVAFDGTRAVIGAYSKTAGATPYQGMVYVYEHVGTAWTKQDEFTSSDGTSGDFFGMSVALSGDTIVVGASGATVGANAQQGAAYVFKKVGSSWAQKAKLTASDGAAYQRFGSGVAIGTPGILVTTAEAKSAYAFSASGETWAATKLTPSYVDSSSSVAGTFGPGVAMYGSTALLGSFVFDAAGGSWVEQARLADPETSDGFGQGGVALDGTSLVVGAPLRKTSSFSSFTPGAAWVLVKGSALGDSCATASSCVSGFCVDGVCCESACTGACMSCSAAKSTAGADGLCRVTKGGTDPDGDCPAQCVGSQLYAASTCSGTASSCTPVSPTSCAPYKCAAVGVACRTSCVDNADCDATAYCGATGCIAKVAVGKACTAGIQCTSGSCVDGVCCSTSCTASCYACSKALTGAADGTCAAIPDGSDPDGNCAAPSCSGTALTRGVCNGTGGCRSSTKDCSPASCVVVGGAATCATPCTSDAACGVTGYCLSGVCTPKLGNGSVCAASSQCTSGFCTDGVCCDVACGGQCEACAESATKGTCTPVMGAPKGGRPTCGADPTCAGKCDGVARTSCARTAAGTVCGAGCAGSVRASCDGAGACLPPSPCPDHLVCQDASTCKSSCAASSDCTTGYKCVSGSCVSALGPNCSADGASSIAADFTVTPCAPYRCDPMTGACRTTCSDSANCMTGATCSDASRCVDATVADAGPDGSAADAIASDDSAPGGGPSDGATSESSSCTYGGSASSGAWVAALAFAVLARRRRPELTET